MKIDTKEDKYIQTNTIEAEESDYLYIRSSQIQNAGRGLYTAINIYKNEIISLFKGKIISNLEAEKRAKEDHQCFSAISSHI